MRYLWLSFRGRTDRKGYALFVVFAYLAGYLFETPMRIDMRSLDSTFPPGDLSEASRAIVWPHDVALPVSIAGWLFVLWIVTAMIAFAVRRLHDMDLSGWFLLLWVVIFLLVPDKTVPHADVLTIRDAVWLGITIMVPGTRGPNTYGPDPSNPVPATTQSA